MRLIVQSPTRPERIIGALEDIVPDKASEIRLSVAYVTESGTRLFIDRVAEKLGRSRWKKVKKRLLTCFDYGITEPEALKTWLALPEASVLIQNADLVVGGNLNPKIAFHAKMYEFRSDTLANLMVGSANLSERALVFNSEAATVHTGLSNLKSLDENWKRLRIGSLPADASLIKAYEVARSKVLLPLPPAMLGAMGAPTQSFWGAITIDAFDPSDYEYFWVDAGNLSGGSSSQLEMPRGANLYFGFEFDDYEPIQAYIGNIDLAVQDTYYLNQALSWHGDNGMERINLPTKFKYSGQVILFRRRKGHFQLTFTPAGSQRALAWATASEMAERRYRVAHKNKNSNRRCGVF